MSAITDAHNDRVRALDPLLAPLASFESDDEPNVLRVRIGRAGAAALFGLTVVDETEPNAVWGTLRRHTADVRLAGDGVDRVRAFDTVLDEWLRRIAEVEEPGDAEASAKLVVPTRDAELANSLFARGFAPTQIRAVRLLPRGVVRRPLALPIEVGGAVVRIATLHDADRLGELDARLLALDAQFATVVERPGAAATFAQAYRERLVRAPNTTWVLERDDVVTGFVHVMPDDESPEPDEPRLVVTGGHNLVVMYLDPGERGSGIGAQLVDVAHRALDACGSPYTMLSYAVANPRSGPFWSRVGYRPAVTEWQRRPAVFRRP
ncbi:GNAT family N-acetyltransferase [Humibacter antri]